MAVSPNLEVTGGFLPFAAAARLAGRSYSWVRDNAVQGRIRTSVDAATGLMLACRTDVMLLATRRRSRPRPSPTLRLVVDNT